ncbi:MAG: YidC/Oxa1 family membrane protein insertase [Clostridia bacterium]|nr:YidC/Oxa1 family membrane protein insertase [Clostridia bacterium]
MFAAISNLFGYLLNFLYELVNNNFGFAIILFSILLRIILLPITIKQQKSMEKTNQIQGELKALQFKYKNNPEMLNKETMELYKREKISPFSGCLSAIVQIIIILSVFYLVSQPLTYMKKANDKNPELKAVVEQYKNEIKDSNSKTRYIEIATIARMRNDYNKISNEQQVENTENQNVENTENNEVVQSKDDLKKKKELLEKLNVNMEFLGLDLSKVPSENLKDFTVYIIPVLYVVSSFISIRMTTNMKKKNDKDDKKDGKDEPDPMAQMSKSMSYMMPIMTLSIAFIAPLGLALYWFVSNVLMIVERVVIKKVMTNKEAE